MENQSAECGAKNQGAGPARGFAGVWPVLRSLSGAGSLLVELLQVLWESRSRGGVRDSEPEAKPWPGVLAPPKPANEGTRLAVQAAPPVLDPPRPRGLAELERPFGPDLLDLVVAGVRGLWPVFRVLAATSAVGTVVFALTTLMAVVFGVIE